MRLLAAFSITDVISSTPAVLPAPMATLVRSLLSLAMSIPGHLYTKTQSVQRCRARHISTSDRHSPLFKLRAQGWTTAQQHAPGQRGSMEDSTELWPRYFHPTATRPTLGTRTLPGNFQYGLYQCDNMQHVNQELFTDHFLNCINKENVKQKLKIHSSVEMFVCTTDSVLTSYCAFCKAMAHCPLSAKGVIALSGYQPRWLKLTVTRQGHGVFMFVKSLLKKTI